MDDEFEYIELTVDTRNADAAAGSLWVGSSSPLDQLKYSWPKFYWTFKNPEIVGFKVVSVEIPNVYDYYSTVNNTFIYTISGVPTTITLTPGLRDEVAIAADLEATMSAITPGLTVQWEITSGLYFFTQTISLANWSLTFPNRNTLYNILGFVPGSVNSVAGGIFSSIGSTIRASLKPNYITLNSRTLGPLINYNLTEDAQQAGGGPQIFKIPTNSFQTVHYYNNPNTEKFFDFKGELNQFDLYLTPPAELYQIPLDMKGTSWSVTFGLLARRGAAPSMRAKIRNGISKIQ